MINKFFALSRKKQILTIVWVFHFIFIFALFIHHVSTFSWRAKKPIAIRTFIPKQELKIAKIQAAPKPSAKQDKPLPQKKTAKKQSDKSHSSTGNKSKISAPTKSVNELTEAIEILKELETSAQKRPVIELPSTVKLQPNLSEPSHPSYGQFVIGYLEQNLSLPEFGDVKIKLKIDQEGRVIESLVISSENGKNSDFLKNELPRLRFPCFNDFDIHEKELTFTLSFRNAENRY